MTTIALKIRRELEGLDRMKRCARLQENECEGRLSWEHSMGRKRQEVWNIICLCEKHAGIGRWWSKHYFNKELNRHLAYSNISEEALSRYKTGETMKQEKLYLQNIYENNPMRPV